MIPMAIQATPQRNRNTSHHLTALSDVSSIFESGICSFSASIIEPVPAAPVAFAKRTGCAADAVDPPSPFQERTYPAAAQTKNGVTGEDVSSAAFRTVVVVVDGFA